MEDRPISVTLVAAVMFWFAAAMLVGLDLWLDSARLGRAGLFCSVAGATVTVRRYACTAVQAVTERERNAFELGRDAAGLRSLR